MELSTDVALTLHAFYLLGKLGVTSTARVAHVCNSLCLVDLPVVSIHNLWRRCCVAKLPIAKQFEAFRHATHRKSNDEVLTVSESVKASSMPDGTTIASAIDVLEEMCTAEFTIARCRENHKTFLSPEQTPWGRLKTLDLEALSLAAMSVQSSSSGFI
jgi:hypothetical protein